MAQKIWLLYGLGNKDSKYQNTYHNLGWLFLDWLSKTNGLKTEAWQSVCKDRFLITKLPSESSQKDMPIVLLAKRVGYMNESGENLPMLLKYLKIDINSLVVIQDDSDLSFSNYKLSWNKNDAGHKGIISVNNILKTKAYWRLRLGSRSIENKAKAMAFALKKIRKEEFSLLDETFQKGFDEIMKLK